MSTTRRRLATARDSSLGAHVRWFQTRPACARQIAPPPSPPPLRHGSLSRRGLGRVRARGSSPRERARVPRAPVSRARVSRRGRRADRGCVPRFARPPAQGAHRGDAPPRQVRPSGRVRAALARHPRPVPGVRRGIPQPLGRGRRARARPRRRGRRRGRDVRGARAPPSRRGWLPPRARPREPPPARRPKPPAPPRARVGGASRGRLRPRARRRARAQPRIRRARRFPVPPPALPARQRRLTRRRARRRARAPSRKSARTSTTRAPPSTRAETNTTPSETPARRRPISAARLGRRREPLPPRRARARGSARRRRATPAFARRRQSSRKDCGRRSRTSRRSNARARLVAFVFENRGATRREFRRSLLGARATAASFVRVRGVAEPRRGRARCARGGDGGDDGGDPRGVRRHSAATTFYAWVESALALEDERRDDDDDDEDESSFPGHVNGHDVNEHDRSRVLGDAIRAVASAARRAGPALRSRRRGVEAIANAWSRARRRAEEDHDEAERLAKRSERAANGLPTFDTFREGGTSERFGDRGTSERFGDRGTRELRFNRVRRFTEERLETPAKSSSLADLAPAMFADATPPPEDVEAALVARGATLRKVTNETRDASPRASDEREPSAGDVAESRSARGGSSPETPEDAAARLDELARASEAALARTRRRARAFLATRVEAVFGRDEEGDPRPRWSRGGPRGRTVVRADETDRTRREGGDAGTVCVCEHVARTRRGA